MAFITAKVLPVSRRAVVPKVCRLRYGTSLESSPPRMQASLKLC
jgi:hypothetical protein